MKKYAAFAISELQKKGAEKAQCRVLRTEKQEINVENGNITLMRTNFNTSVSLSAIVEGRRAGIAINQCDEREITKACDAVMEMARASQSDEANDIAAWEEGPEQYISGPSCGDMGLLKSRLKELLDTVNEKYSNVKLDGQCAFNHSKEWWANTNGVAFENEDGRYSVSFMFSAKENGVAASFNYAGASARSLDTPLWDMGGIGMLIEQNVRELEAKPLKDKFTGDIIVAPLCLTDFLELYISTFLNDTPLVSGTSVLKDKLGHKVAGDNVTIISDPLDPELCGYPITNDAFRARIMTIIENGVLKNFCLSQYGANRTGMARSGNTGDMAQMQAGLQVLDDLIRSVDRGLLVSRFSGGHPNENGDFSGVAKNSFYIERGKIVFPVLETMISANLREMFYNVKGISSETISTGEGKQPWVLFSGITISGA